MVASCIFAVEGMTCQSCVQAVEQATRVLLGVISVTVSLAKHNALVTYDSDKVSIDAIQTAISDAGFEATQLDQRLTGDGRIQSQPAPEPSRLTVQPKQGTEGDMGTEVAETTEGGELDPALITTHHLKVIGMSCASCVAVIEGRVRALQGVSKIAVSLLSETAEVDLNEAIISPEQVCQVIEEAGFEASVLDIATETKTTLIIRHMTCASCVATIENRIGSMPGVNSISVALTTSKALIDFDPNLTGPRTIIQAIDDLGFEAELASASSGDDAYKQTRAITFWRNNFVASVLYFIPINVIKFLKSESLDHFVYPALSVRTLCLFILSTLAIVHVGRTFLVAGTKAILHRAPNMDSLIAIGTFAAYIYSVVALALELGTPVDAESGLFFETGAMLFTFVSCGRWLEHIAKGKTSEAMSKLMELQATEAVLITTDEDGNTQQERISIDLVQRGDTVKVVAGEKLPVDGVVVDGSGEVDESMITGEPMLVTKSEGLPVIGGTILKLGVLHCKATRVGSDTSLSRIVQLMEQAQMSKAPAQLIADRIARVFVPGVVVLSVTTLIIWLIILGTEHVVTDDGSKTKMAFRFAIAVLVVACPCALGLATPTAVMVGTGIGAKFGILIKGGVPLETARKTDTVVFDKTGTLTEGRPTLSEVCVLDLAFTENEALKVIASAEQNSEHVLAQSIVEAAQARLGDVYCYDSTNYQTVPGQGIRCIVNESQVLVGNVAFLKSHDITITDTCHDHLDRLETSGQTAVVAAMDDRLLAVVAVRDQPKPEAARVVEILKHQNIEVVMLTGDNERTARCLAQELGIDTVIAQVLPAHKAAKIEALQQEKKTVTMVGDGINDAPALASADLGVAVGAGTDVALEAADIVLMRDDLMDLLTAIHLSKATVRRIHFNFLWAVIYNGFGLPLAAGAFYVLGVVLSPMIAASAMALSSVSVVLSSLVLRLYKRPTFDEVPTNVIRTQSTRPRLERAGSNASDQSNQSQLSATSSLGEQPMHTPLLRLHASSMSSSIV
eukprot:m.18491 g.18491  ORF g.18491 m.18491 type:complete len:1017 (-) comp7880_c0_seq1:380-3430(-)